MLNKVMLIGRLGADPEVRYTPQGTKVTSFNLATDERWKDKDGNKQERTEWHKVVVWGKLADICGEYLAKGKLVYLEGSLRTRSWDDRDGQKRYTTEIIASDMKMLDKKGGGSGGSYSQGGEPPRGQQVNEPDDIPF